MTEWFEQHIVAVQPHKSMNWQPWPGAAMTLVEAKKHHADGRAIMCQKREKYRTFQLAWMRDTPERIEPQGIMRRGKQR